MLFIIFFFGLLFILLLCNYDLYSQLKYLNGNIRKWRSLWFITSILIILSPFIGMILVLSNLIESGSLLSKYLSLIFLLFSFPQIIFGIFSLFGILPFYKFPRIKKFNIKIGFVIIFVSFVFLLYGNLIGIKKITFEKILIQSNNIPSNFNDYRIIQISDLHLGSLLNNPEFVNQIVDTINSLKPDVILFTGDIVNHSYQEIFPFQEELTKLRATDGIYSVMGNHDYGYNFKQTKETENQNIVNQKRIQNQMGWQLLLNEHQFIHRKNDSIAIIGVEDWGGKHFGKRGNLNNAMHGISDSTYSILLSHNPVHWDYEVKGKTSIELTLSGHTHAMQFQIGSFSPSKWIYPYWSGLYKYRNQILYVNRGIGYIGFPIRIGAYPEITLLELRNNNL